MGWDIERRKYEQKPIFPGEMNHSQLKETYSALIKDKEIYIYIYFCSYFLVYEAAAVWKAPCQMYILQSKPTDYNSTSEGYKAANQMLRMSPAGITVSHICLLTVSNSCLHFAQQILLSEENLNILNSWKSFCGQGEIRLLDKQGDMSPMSENVKQSHFIDTNGNLTIDSDSADYRESRQQK